MAIKLLLIFTLLQMRDIGIILKELIKPEMDINQREKLEKEVKRFVSESWGVVKDKDEENKDQDHRFTLRIPQWLMDKVDEELKKRIGSVSRNQLILEILQKNFEKNNS